MQTNNRLFLATAAIKPDLSAYDPASGSKHAKPLGLWGFASKVPF